MKTILLATDYSHPASNALEYAAHLASHAKAKLVLFNAFHLAIPSPLPPATLLDVEELIDANKRRLEGIAADIRRRFKITVESTSSTLTLLEGLNNAVKCLKADAVVMGMKGHSFGRKLFGSATTAVIRQAKYPVLVVPEAAAYHPISSILFACNYNNILNQNRLELLSQLAECFKARVHVVHVASENSRATFAESTDALKIPAMEAVLAGTEHSYHSLHNSDVIEGLKAGILRFRANMLVMVPRSNSSWDLLLSQSKTQKMALESSIPLLVLPNLKSPRLQRKMPVSKTTLSGV